MATLKKTRMIIVIVLAALVPCIMAVVSVDSRTKPFDTESFDNNGSSSSKDFLEESAYKPDEIIVKFKEPVAEFLEEQLSDGETAATLSLSASLDNLSRKHKVNNIKPLIKNFKANRQRIEALKKKDKADLTKRERHLVNRLKRAPEGVKVPDLGRIYKIELEPGQSALDAAEEYNTDPQVEYAELNYIVSICSTEPNDPNYTEQWALTNIGQMYPWDGRFAEPPGTPDCDIDANEAWDLHTGSSDIVVAVIDTGVDYTHRDLQYNMWTDANGCYGYDFINDDNDPIDDHGHGTHCAGTIAADSNNGFDIAGVSWNAKIMALKFLNSSGVGYTTDAVLAINYAVDNGADITSNSWGGGGYLQALADAIYYAYSQGIVTVAAAGNDNSTTPGYPADYNDVISVAATDSNDDRASFSNYGEWVDIAAPGVDILSLHASGTDIYGDGQHYYPDGDPDASMYIASGTSMACPHVSGVCALLLSVNPYMTPDDVNEILTDATSVDPITDGICRSDGRVNAYKALSAAIPSKGYISLNQDYYNCDCNVGIYLTDVDLTGQGTQGVNITTSGGDLETVTLSETDANTGIFIGEISTESGEPNIGDGLLQVYDGNTITVTYEDANDGSGSPASPNDTATVDCVYPNIISDVNVSVVGPDVTVTFETDEYTVGRVSYGLSCGGSYESYISYGTNHSIKLFSISPWTAYYFEVEATDVAGNSITDDNDSNCYTFTTSGPNDFNVPGDYNTIQEAIDESWDSGTITVATGTYYESIDFKGRAITVTSTDPNDWEVVKATIIDANLIYSHAVKFESSEDHNSILTGFTVQNGRPYGINCLISSPTIRDCIIENNIWGINCDGGSSPIITNNKIKNNNGYSIHLLWGSPIIQNNWIYGNGWGMRIKSGGSAAVICNNSIVNNETYGIYFSGTTLSVTNCILRANEDDLYICTATYSCVQDPNDANGVGNITSDPCLVNIFDFVDLIEPNGTTTIVVKEPNLYEINDVIEYDDDGVVRTVTDINTDSNTITFVPALDSNPTLQDLIYNWGPNVTGVNEDCHLMSDSPCINTGDPNGDYSGQTDIDGEPRVQGTNVDMGADEVHRVHNVDKDEWYVTIQAAIDDANDGNEIVVYPGTYIESVNFGGKAITLTGTDPNDWDIVETTIISPNNASSTGVRFETGEDANSILTGLTIKGIASSGVFCGSGTYPVITKCNIMNNTIGGVTCNSATGTTISNNKIHGNTVHGIYILGCAVDIKNNWVYDNKYGIKFLGVGPNTIVYNSTFVNNTDYGIRRTSGSLPDILNCILWDNGSDLTDCSATYSCIEDCNDASGVGNICGDANDPLFVDPNNDDYHLDVNSPCIDTGNPNTDPNDIGPFDLDGNDRFIDGTEDGNDFIDMGSYEYDPDA